MEEWRKQTCKQCDVTFIKERRVQQFCSIACQFWSKVAKAGDDDCWIWQGTINSDGYGCFFHNYKTLLAHRISYELHNAQLNDLLALHRCDNPPCVNPSHLFAGTQADNVHDRVTKGRSRYVSNAVRGSESRFAKLTEAGVQDIRSRHDQGERQADLAREYGVTRGGIWRIVARKCWKHI